jgi:hypothetical protein
VDFRASGTVKMENGFHVMPGAFFHAYQEPKWGATVFSDDFDSTALDRSKWYVDSGWGDAASGAEISSDSNMSMDTDYQATDGHALDLYLRETLPDTVSGPVNAGWMALDDCQGTIIDSLPHPKFIFSSPSIRSCPWPYVYADSPLVQANAHGPYGKYEVREKIPHTLYHTNTWGGILFEYDMSETYLPYMNAIHPQIQNFGFPHGPYKGVFGRRVIAPGDTQVVFRSSQPSWSYLNKPYILIINGFPYTVQYQVWPPHDSSVFATPKTSWEGGFPPSLANDTADTVMFYYERAENNVADTLTWKVTQAPDSSWRVFHAPYHVDCFGDTQRFSKAYQPTSVILTVDTGLFVKKDTLACNWMYWLESPIDSSLIYLEQPISPTDLHGNREAYQYTINEGDGNYMTPGVPFNAYDTTGGYEYHTFSMEMLPHEVRFLVDSNVVRRIPDRLVPPGNPYYDRATQIPRSPPNIFPSEMDMGNPSDPFGLDTGSEMYTCRKYFEHAAAASSWPGFWPVSVGGHTYPAAHLLLDYIKMWDVPADVKIPDFPH